MVIGGVCGAAGIGWGVDPVDGGSGIFLLINPPSLTILHSDSVTWGVHAVWIGDYVYWGGDRIGPASMVAQAVAGGGVSPEVVSAAHSWSGGFGPVSGAFFTAMAQ